MLCLRAFDFTQEVTIGRQEQRELNNPVLRIPARDPLAEALLEGRPRPNRWRRRDPAGRPGGQALNVIRGRLGLAHARSGSAGRDLVTAVAGRLHLDWTSSIARCSIRFLIGTLAAYSRLAT